MAVIHQATLSPTKLELLASWLGRQPWAGSGGELERLGTYRFDDPAGEVGIEGFLLRRGAKTLHVVLTYRGAPLSGADDWLVGTMEHSVLGTRWVYDGIGDPVGQDALRRALRGEQEQAVLEVHDEAGAVVQRLEPEVRVRSAVAGDEAIETPVGAAGEDGFAVVDSGDSVGSGNGRLFVARVPSSTRPGRQQLVASWPHSEAVIAVLG